MEYTKGKWVACGNGSTVWVENELWSIAIICYKERQQQKANATLIAAAPDLLEALQKVMDTFVLFKNSDLTSEALEVKLSAQQAIEKALTIK